MYLINFIEICHAMCSIENEVCIFCSFFTGTVKKVLLHYKKKSFAIDLMLYF